MHVYRSLYSGNQTGFANNRSFLRCPMRFVSRPHTPYTCLLQKIPFYSVRFRTQLFLSWKRDYFSLLWCSNCPRCQPDPLLALLFPLLEFTSSIGCFDSLSTRCNFKMPARRSQQTTKIVSLQAYKTWASTSLKIITGFYFWLNKSLR